jgi:peptidoglycan/LPS O-acetylase OafA/YrhL
MCNGTPSHANALTYRPEIDGLRFLAVILVILHHLEISLFSGGFIGVDVFFVISGYLITSILFKEAANGGISFSGFYKRRVVRLAPAFFVVVFFTSIAAYALMLPSEIVAYAKSLVSSVFFVANFYMWNEIGGYFVDNAATTPLLHLWSLSVEEQFYIVWPFFIMVLAFLKKRVPIFSLILIVTVAGALFSEWGVRNYLSASYYLLPTRFFELSAGGMLAFIPALRGKNRLFFILPWAGLLMICYSAFYYTPSMLFPGFSAALPVIGTVILIRFLRADSLLGKIFSSGAFVSLGKVSYPAYLWHWPIIAYLNIMRVPISFWVGFMVVVCTFLLSFATYYGAERPAAKLRSSSPFKVILFGFFLPVIASLLFAYYVQKTEGVPERFSDSLVEKSHAIGSWASRIRGACHNGYLTGLASKDECVLGRDSGPVDFLLIGDSHANHFTGMMSVFASEAGLRGYDSSQSNTIYLPGVDRIYFKSGQEKVHSQFRNKNEVWTELIKKNKYKAVVLGGSYAIHYNSESFVRNDDRGKQVFRDSFRHALRVIEESGARAYVIMGAPVLIGINHDCGLMNERFGKSLPCKYSRTKHEEKFEEWMLFVSELKSEFPRTTFIDPVAVLCDKDYCYAELDGLPFYHDGNHLNYVGSQEIGRRYIQQFGNPMDVISR